MTPKDVCVLTCVVGGQLLPIQTVDDVCDGDRGVQISVVRHLGLLDVGAVAHSEDIGETVDLQEFVDLQSSVIGQAVGYRHTDL